MTEDHKPNTDRAGFGTKPDLISNAITFLSYAAREAAAQHIEASAKMRGKPIGEREIEQLAQAQNVIGQAAVLVGSMFSNLERIAAAAERLALDAERSREVLFAETPAQSGLSPGIPNPVR